MRKITHLKIAAPIQLGSIEVQDSHSIKSNVAGMFITNNCPLSCNHCFNDSSPKKDLFLNLSEMKSYIDWLQNKNHGINTISISGGEPFSHPELNNIISYAKKSFSNVHVTTGAGNVTIESLSQAIEAGLESITISTDQYHQKFVPIHKIEKICAFLIENRIKTIINIAYSSNQELTKLLQQLDSYIPQEVSAVTFPVFSEGRAVKINSSIIEPDNKCSNEVITLNFDGNIYSSCDLSFNQSNKIYDLESINSNTQHETIN